MTTFFSLLSFFATGYGVLITMILAGAMLVLWDWRLMLGTLLVVQLSVATQMVVFHQVAERWMIVQSAVMLLSCSMLAISAQQMRTTALLRRRNNMGIQLLIAPLLVGAWWLLQIDLSLPMLNPALRQLFLWLAVVALALLSLGNEPLSVGVGLLLWCVPLQAIAVLFVPIPVVIALLGLMELILGLACAYLLVTDRNPALTPQKTTALTLRSRTVTATGAVPSSSFGSQRLRPSARAAAASAANNEAPPSPKLRIER